MRRVAEPGLVLLPLFDLPELSGRLGAALRQAGIPVSPQRCVRFVEALHLLPPVDRDTLYWAARLSFVTGRAQVAPFDAVFDRLFSQAAMVAPSGRGRNRASGPAEPPRPATGMRWPPSVPPARVGTQPGVSPNDSSRGQRDGTPSTVRAVASRQEALASKDFAAMEADEAAAVQRLLEALVVATPTRPVRRRQPRANGRHIDLRRTLRLSQRSGGDPVRLARSRPVARPRPLVLLCDISGSMEPYTRAYLHFFQRAAASGVRAEAFVFATRLTRLTPVLRGGGNTDAALRAAGTRAPDWSGGTRIGASLAEFNNRYGRPGLARGAVVVIFSDGWERDDPAVLRREMARLSRLAYRVVWVNPRKASPGFSPQAAGMAAALPYCEFFVCGHSVAALAQVIQAIGGSVKSDGRSDKQLEVAQ